MKALVPMIRDERPGTWVAEFHVLLFAIDFRANRRRSVAEIDSGTAKLVPAEEVFAEVRRLLK